MNERRRLSKIDLEGPRAWVRKGWFGLVIVLSWIGGLGYLLPAHRVNGAGDFHSNYADGGPFSLFAFAAVFGGALLLRKRGLGFGMLSGVIATAGAICAVAPVILVHLFATVQTSIGEGMFAAGVIGLFVSGILMVVAEPILYVVQRRALERKDPPIAQLPIARIA